MTQRLATTVIGNQYTTNSVCVTHTDSPPSATKQFSADQAKQWQNELDAYRILSHVATYHVPTLLDFGKRESAYFLKLEYVDSAPAEFTNDSLGMRLAEQLGGILRQIHAADISAWKRAAIFAGSPYVPSHCQYWSRLASDAAIRSDCPGNSVWRRLQDWIRLFRPAVDDTSRSALIHRDLESRNILCTDQGRLLIVDWEVSTIGHPDLDMARLFWRGFRDSRELIDAFYAGYQTSARRKSREYRAFFRVMFCLEMLDYLYKSATNGDLGADDLISEIRRSLQLAAL